MHKYNERLKEIETRKAELTAEVGKPETTTERLAAIKEEAGQLRQEEQELRSRLDLKEQLKPGSVPEQRGGKPSDLEQRAAEFRKTSKMTIHVEARGLTVASGQLVQTTRTSGINDNLDTVGGILGMANVVDAHGMGGDQVSYVKTIGNADGDTEGASTEGKPDFGHADIAPQTVDIYTQVSREVRNLTNLGYYERVQQLALRSLRTKLAQLIVAGGSGKTSGFKGIAKSTVIDAPNLVIAAIDDKTLRKIALNYGTDDAIVGSAVLFLTKADLIAFGDVRGADKKAVYEITPDAANPNMGIIKDGGLSVRYSLCSKLTKTAAKSVGAITMVYGNPNCYQLDIFGDYTVEVQDNLKERMMDVLGEVMAGGEVTVYNGFVRCVAADH